MASAEHLAGCARRELAREPDGGQQVRRCLAAPRLEG